MATQRQIEANRRNSQLSTGPRTAAGKAICRMNALKTGVFAKLHVVRGENPADLRTLVHEYIDHFLPANREEQALVTTLIKTEWRLRRYHLSEMRLWNRALKRLPSCVPEDLALGQAFAREARHFLRLDCVLAAARRRYKHAHDELYRLRSLRRPAVTPPAPRPAPRPVVLAYVPTVEQGLLLQ